MKEFKKLKDRIRRQKLIELNAKERRKNERNRHRRPKKSKQDTFDDLDFTLF